MIFVTGDTHGLYDFFKLEEFAKNNPKLTKDDYVIIAGDFGALWEEGASEKTLKYYSDLPFTILFVDGNHENFDMLNSYPVTTWKGGKVHQIKPDIIHLMRGQVFEIEGNTIFTFGGATSIDKFMRKEGLSWWEQELPSYEELDEGIANLKRIGGKVDYIITHSCPERALLYPAMIRVASYKQKCPEYPMLSYIEDNAKFKHWYYGHFHTDARMDEKFTVLYNDIVELGE